MHRRSVLAGAGMALIAPSAGCSAGGRSTPVSSAPEYDRTVLVSNRDTERHTVGITITHDGSAGVVHEERRPVAPDEAVDVYDFTDAPTEGVETYTIAGRLEAGGRASIRYRTNRCHSSPVVYVSSEGEIRATYAMC